MTTAKTFRGLRTWNGMQVVTLGPTTYRLRRSLRERWFTRPWHPFVAYETRTEPAPVKPGTYLITERTVYISEDGV